MLNLKLRMSYLKKIAQTVDEAMESIEDTGETTTESTNIESKIKNLSAPETFSMSSRNPSLRIAFTAPIVASVDALANRLNTFLYYTSLGKYDMMSLITQPETGATDIASRDFKPLFYFCKSFFEVLNNDYLLY